MLYNEIMITPNTDLILLKCPIELDQTNQLTFANATAQFNYFNSLPKIERSQFTYQRKDNTVRFDANFDDILTFNYCMYRNSSYSNKWFYAFVSNAKYINDSTTEVTLKTDVWQTWQFDLNFKQSFVIREHVNDDVIGRYTQEEDLPIGEPIINHYQLFEIANNNNDSQRVVMQVTQLPDGVTEPEGYRTHVYNGIPQGTFFLVFSGFSSATRFAWWYDKKGQRDALLAMFLVPHSMVSTAHYENFTIGDGGGSVNVGFLPASFNAHYWTPPSVYYSSTLGGYTPKNKRLYSYPFSYLMVSNSAGSNIVYRYEDFDDPTHPAFECRGTLGQGCSIRLYPNLYKYYSLNSPAYDYGISCAKLPLLSWTSDYYLNWQAQNATNLAVQTTISSGKSVLQGVNAAANAFGKSQSGKPLDITDITSIVNSGLDLASDISNLMQEHHVADLVPAQAIGNTNCADLTYAMDRCGFAFFKMSCRAEYARLADNFFSMFGYKINNMKVPNITGRANWNYVKTKGCNVIANIPQLDLQEIKAMFDGGLTLWHNPATFQDYSQNNNIV